MEINEHIAALLDPEESYTQTDIDALCACDDPRLLVVLDEFSRRDHRCYMRLVDLLSKRVRLHLLNLMIATTEYAFEADCLLHLMTPALNQQETDLLFPLLFRDEGEMTVSVARALSHLNDPVIAARLLVHLSEDRTLPRVQAAVALAYYHYPQSLPLLLDALVDSDRLIRKLACNGLAELADDVAIEPLTRLAILDADELVRDAAVNALGQIGGLPVIDTLIAAPQDPDASVRITAANRLGTLQYPQAVDALIAAVQTDPDTSVRCFAIHALEEIESPRALPPLLAALRDTDPGIRAAAAGALDRFQDPCSFPPLIQALDDPDPLVRRIAADTLAEIPSFHTDDPAIVAKIHGVLHSG